MKRNEILRDLMEQQGLRTSDLVKTTGIPYSTLKSIFENGVEKSGYSNICAICQALGITSDELEQMAGECPSTLRLKQLQVRVQDFSGREWEELEQYISFLRFRRQNHDDT